MPDLQKDLHMKVICKSTSLAPSAAGHKPKPIVISKADNPRCFRGIDKASLPVMYRANNISVMIGGATDTINSEDEIVYV